MSVDFETTELISLDLSLPGKRDQLVASRWTTSAAAERKHVSGCDVTFTSASGVGEQ